MASLHKKYLIFLFITAEPCQLSMYDGKLKYMPFLQEHDNNWKQGYHMYIVDRGSIIKEGDYFFDYCADEKPNKLRQCCKVVGDKIYDSPITYNKIKNLSKVVACTKNLTNVNKIDEKLIVDYVQQFNKNGEKFAPTELSVECYHPHDTCTFDLNLGMFSLVPKLNEKNEIMGELIKLSFTRDEVIKLINIAKGGNNDIKDLEQFIENNLK